MPIPRQVTRTLGKRAAFYPSARAITRTLGRSRSNSSDSSDSSSGGDSGGASGGGDSGAQEQAQTEEQPQEQTQTEEQPQEQPAANIGQDVAFPLVSAHGSNGRLHTSAICITPHGCSVIHCRTKGNHNGPVNFGVERNSPALRRPIATSKKLLLLKSEDERRKQKAGEIVQRARCGDQNAMAIIALVRDNQKKGNPKAAKAYGLIKKYIDDNPVSNFGGVDKKTAAKSFFSSVMLANGASLSNKRLNNTAAAFGHESNIFFQGFSKGKVESKDVDDYEVHLDDIQRQIYRIGNILGFARKIQNLRNPNCPISQFCPQIAWELGE